MHSNEVCQKFLSWLEDLKNGGTKAVEKSHLLVPKVDLDGLKAKA